MVECVGFKGLRERKREIQSRKKIKGGEAKSLESQ